MAREHILAIDNGTQSARALLFDLQGNLIAASRVPIEPYFSNHSGWAEQNPEYFWQAICQACQKLWTLPGVQKDALAGITLTTQRGTVINVDRDGKPLRPAIIWLDQRRTDGLKPVSGLWGLIFRALGMTETVAYLQSEAEANWIRTCQSDIWAKTYKYLLLSGYLTYRLTGRFVDSVGCQVGYIPFDYKNLRWASGHDWKWQAIPMPRAMLPDLVPPTASLGQITAAAAEETGIPVGLPVIAAAADKACEVIGSGALQPHIGCIGYGTTATINVTHHKYLEAIPLIPPYPAAVPGAYSLEFQVYRGYWMVSWFKNEFGHQEQQLAKEQGIEVEKLLDRLIDESPPGSEGLVLQPYWSPGIKIPGPEARGAVIGFSDVHTRAHLYRAILEGVAYALREGRERSERCSHIKITELRASGGGAQSDAAIQLTADVFGLPTARLHTFETSGLGAAIDAAVGLKLHPNFDTAIREMVRIGRVFEPDPHTSEIYNSLFEGVYKRMYPSLRPLYHTLKKIIK